MKRANRGERTHLTAYEDHEGVYYCSQKCLNIIIEGIDKRIKARSESSRNELSPGRNTNETSKNNGEFTPAN